MVVVKNGPFVSSKSAVALRFRSSNWSFMKGPAIGCGGRRTGYAMGKQRRVVIPLVSQKRSPGERGIFDGEGISRGGASFVQSVTVRESLLRSDHRDGGSPG